MTCIVGIAQDNEVWIGGDNAGFINGTVIQYHVGKVFHIDEFVMGCSGNQRFGNLMRFAFDPPVIELDLDAYMVMTFVDALRETLTKHGYLANNNGREAISLDDGDSALIGVRGRLFRLSPSFCITSPMDGMFAIGYGMTYALGALYATPKLSPKERILLALEAGEKYSDGVIRPFRVISTKRAVNKKPSASKANAVMLKAWESIHASRKQATKGKRVAK